MKTSPYKNLDAGESIFFERQLTKVKSNTYDVKYPAYKARELLPVSFDAGAGTQVIAYEQYDSVGMAKLIANYADDLPRADVKAKQFFSPVRSLGDSYGWNLNEVRAAAQAGKDLKGAKAAAAKKAMLAEENRLAFFGDTASGLGGLINNANIGTVTLAADGTGSSKAWSTKTGDLILRDMNLVATAVATSSKGVESANTMLLPLAQYNLVFTKMLPDSNGKTVGQFFLDQSPHIKSIDWVNELAGAGASTTDVVLVYDRNPEKLTLEIPVDFEQLPAQERNLEFLVPCHERFGGVLIYYPLSIAKAEGI